MDVCYVTMQFPSSCEPFAATEVKALHNMGLNISVHSLREVQGDPQKLLTERGLEDVPVTYGSFRTVLDGLKMGFLRPGLSFPFLLWVLKCNWKKPIDFLKSLILMPRAIDIFFEIKNKNPDVVHLFWGHYPSLVGHLVKTHMPNTVLSIFLGAYDLLAQYGGSFELARKADVVWTHSKVNIPDIERCGVPKGLISVCYRGIDLTKTHVRDIPKDQNRLIVVARLIKEKGVEEIIRAFSVLSQNWPDASLVILGEGPERIKLEKLTTELGLNSKVSLKGHVPHDQVFKELLASSIFLLLTSHAAERLPNAAKEAMACGCICIVANSPGIQELIEDGQTGYVIPHDMDILIEKISHIFSVPEKAKQISSRAKSFVCKNFDVNKSVLTYGQKWESLKKRE